MHPSERKGADVVTEVIEEAGYFSVPGAHLYVVRNRVENPVARVLLVGPFASERQSSYDHWVRWARYLAARKCEVLRFDYRGTGESTGTFGESGFSEWMEDVQILGDWIAREADGVPLVLHGLEMGAILAGRSFVSGTGDALLMWSAVASANQVLRATLRRWAIIEQFYESPRNRKSFSDFVRDLEADGGLVDVYGYEWSSRLWRESFQVEIPHGLIEEPCRTADRPVKAMWFGRNAEAVLLPFQRFQLSQKLLPLYSSNYEWMDREVIRQHEGCKARC